jgi:hypothetical protein
MRRDSIIIIKMSIKIYQERCWAANLSTDRYIKNFLFCFRDLIFRPIKFNYFQDMKIIEALDLMKFYLISCYSSLSYESLEILAKVKSLSQLRLNFYKLKK